MLRICIHILLCGSFIVSVQALASSQAIEHLSDMLAKVRGDSTVGIFIVNDDITAGIIGKYLPSASAAAGCQVGAGSKAANCGDGKSCLQNIEFSRINPTKYRIRVFKACRNFSLVFSERFDPMWRAYIVRTPDRHDDQHLKVSENDVDSMSGSYIVAKNKYGAIENDNLPARELWETWLSGAVKINAPDNPDRAPDRGSRDPESSGWRYVAGLNSASVQWPDMFHWKVNVFANSWFFDLEAMQYLPRTENNLSGFYVRNADGGVNFEVVVEYWPQRFIYMAYIISVLSVLVCLAAIGLRIKKVGFKL